MVQIIVSGKYDVLNLLVLTDSNISLLCSTLYCCASIKAVRRTKRPATWRAPWFGLRGTLMEAQREDPMKARLLTPLWMSRSLSR